MLSSCAELVTMGQAFSSLVVGLYGRDYNILMLGLIGAGKTTILYKMKLGEITTIVPKIGCYIETVSHRNVKWTISDLDGTLPAPQQGRDPCSDFWRNYTEAVDAVVFVVDSFDRDRVGKARDELHRFMNTYTYFGLFRTDAQPYVQVLANKQDKHESKDGKEIKPMNKTEITSELDLHRLNTQNWYIQPTCGITGDGLYEGLHRLLMSVGSGSTAGAKVEAASQLPLAHIPSAYIAPTNARLAEAAHKLKMDAKNGAAHAVNSAHALVAREVQVGHMTSLQPLDLPLATPAHLVLGTGP